ncbi:MAG: hypothetical protein PHY23_00320 [Oscillospiraceae bacterium]|nr:hypothetical protein [Oscillospiraceae bacterium]
MPREITTTVCIEEVVSQEFIVVHAENENPIKIAIGKYRDGEFVLAPGEVQCRKIAVVASSRCERNWQEF